ncbi:MAG TPA: type II toxin-antitoxin system VapC family toxin [Vicinamibacterales bacterium]|nr:type II toxin-antitoxin system VapC family toxin [Vicinamibacterales bacterium]
MKFWDTSALVPLIVDEPATPDVVRLLTEDRDVVVWMMTSVELLSTLGRLGRATPDLADLLPGVRLDALELFRKWAAVTHVEGVRRRAERLVGVHSLTAADAMQLGAALLASGDRPETLDFVTLDQPLGRCAQLEGFRVHPKLPTASSARPPGRSTRAVRTT